MSTFSVGAKNAMLDSQTLDRVRLHSGDPGSAGTANQLGSLEAATFGSASSGERTLSSDVAFTGLTASQSVTWCSIWDNNGGTPVFKAKAQITSGDVAANAAGEYTLKSPGTKVQLIDPS
jgi:hypothetical protein